MQNKNPLNPTEENLELFHVQTNRSFELPQNYSIICIGKQDGQNQVDIDVSDLPNADIVSRLHAEIQIEADGFYIRDIGSSNGTYINGIKLEPRKRYPLSLDNWIDLGQDSKVTFIFQNKKNAYPAAVPTTIQPQAALSNRHPPRKSQFIGLGLMVAGVVFFGLSTHVGFILRLPGVLLGIAGVILMTWRGDFRYVGWILIAMGIVVIAFTGNIFASVNLLSIFVSSALFLAGYQLFNTGKIGIR